MQFLSIVRVNESADHGPDERLVHAMGKLMQEMTEAGVLPDAAGVAPTSEGMRLRLGDGRSTRVDGPFTGAKEMIGGFFLIDVSSRDEALAIAAECPAAPWATIEVRRTGICYE